MKPMTLHEFFTSFFFVFYRTIRTTFSSVLLARGALSNPNSNATIAILLRLKKNLELLLKLKLSLELLTNLFI